MSVAKSRRWERETVRIRSIHVVCEHFEPFRNTTMGTYSSCRKYVPIELITVTICRKPPDDFVSVGKLSEQIRAR